MFNGVISDGMNKTVTKPNEITDLFVTETHTEIKEIKKNE